MNKYSAFIDVIKSIARKAVPAEEALIRGNIGNNVGKMVDMSKELGGFSFNPRTGEFLNPGQDFGYMMATVPERVGMNRVAADAPDLQDQVLRLMSDPYYMKRLTQGQYLGGWLDEGDLVVDPSQRFLNKNRSILLGADVGKQMGGFDVSKPIGEGFYGLSPEVIQKARDTQELRAAYQALAILIGAPATALGTGLAVRARSDR
jgi:hypothetical protein